MGNCLSAENSCGSTEPENAQECAASLQPTQQDCAAETQKEGYKGNRGNTADTGTSFIAVGKVSTSGRSFTRVTPSESQSLYTSALSGSSSGRQSKNQESKQAKLSEKISEPSPCCLLSQKVDGLLEGVSTHPNISISQLNSCTELGDLLHAFTISMGMPLVLMELYCLEQKCYTAKSTSEGKLQWRCMKVPSNFPILEKGRISTGNPLESAQQVDPMWVEKGLVSYIAVPLQASNGQLIGALCFLDVKDVKIDSALWRLLNNFSDLAMRVIESHNGLYGNKPAASSKSSMLPGSPGKIEVTGSRTSAGEPQVTSSVSSHQLEFGASRANASPADASHAAPSHARNSRGSVTSSQNVNSSQTYTSFRTGTSWCQTGNSSQTGTSIRTGNSSQTNTSCQTGNSSQERDTTALEHSCSILLDIADGCCQILHVGSSWKTWTGQDRTTAQGGRLEDLIAAAGRHHVLQCTAMADPPSPKPLVVRAPNSYSFPLATGVGRPPVHWPGVLRALSKGRRHVLHCMAMADPPSPHPLVVRAPNSYSSPLATGVGRPPVHWPGVLRALSKGRHHVLHCMAMADEQQGYLRGEDVATRTFDISFIPACKALLDSDVVQFSTPTDMPEDKNSHKLRRFYFARLHLSSSQPTHPLHLVTVFSSQQPGQSQQQSNQEVSQCVCGLLNVDTQLKYLFSGMTLSTVLGKGSYGVAYLASWHGTDVVTKIQTQTLNDGSARDYAPLEIALGLRVNHPNIVQTLAHAVLPKPKPIDACPSPSLTPSMFASSDWNTSHTLPRMPYSFEGSQVPLSERSSVRGRNSLAIPFVWHENHSPTVDANSRWTAKNRKITRGSVSSSALGRIPIISSSPFSQGGGIVRGCVRTRAIGSTTSPSPLSHGSRECGTQQGTGFTSSQVPQTGVVNLTLGSKAPSSNTDPVWPSSWTSCNALPLGSTFPGSIRTSSEESTMPILSGDAEFESWMNNVAPCATVYEEPSELKETILSTENTQVTFWRNSLPGKGPCAPIYEDSSTPKASAGDSARFVRGTQDSPPQGDITSGSQVERHSSFELIMSALQSSGSFPEQQMPATDMGPSATTASPPGGTSPHAAGSSEPCPDNTGCVGNEHKTFLAMSTAHFENELSACKSPIGAPQDSPVQRMDSSDLESMLYAQDNCAHSSQSGSSSRSCSLPCTGGPSGREALPNQPFGSCSGSPFDREAQSNQTSGTCPVSPSDRIAQSKQTFDTSPASSFDREAQSNHTSGTCSVCPFERETFVSQPSSTFASDICMATFASNIKDVASSDKSGSHRCSKLDLSPANTSSPPISPDRIFPDGLMEVPEVAPSAVLKAIKVVPCNVDEVKPCEAPKESCANSIPGYDHDEYPMTLRSYIVLEHCDRGCLQEAISLGWLRTHCHEAAPIDYNRVLYVAMGMACGLENLHLNNVVHADLSGSNVLLQSDDADSPKPLRMEDNAWACLLTGGQTDHYPYPLDARSSTCASRNRIAHQQQADRRIIILITIPPVNHYSHHYVALRLTTGGQTDHYPYPLDARSSTGASRNCIASQHQADRRIIILITIPPVNHYSHHYVALRQLTGGQTDHYPYPLDARSTTGASRNRIASQHQADRRIIILITIPPVNHYSHHYVALRLLTGGQTDHYPYPLDARSTTGVSRTRFASQYQQQADRLCAEGDIVMGICDEEEEVDYTTAWEAPKNLVAKIADFGKSVVLGPGESVTIQGSTTVTHAAPEVLAHGDLSRAADVYSYGVLLWSMCTGRQPWEDMSYAQLICAVTMGTSELQWPCSVPSSLSELGKSCLQRTPQLRPTFTSVRATLESCSATPQSRTFQRMSCTSIQE
eukprot:gene29241-12487_t